MKTSTIIAFCAAGLIVIVSFNGYNSTLKEGTRLENSLVAQYRNAQISLSSHVNTIYEQAGIADRKSEKLTEALRAYVGGRNLGNGNPTSERQAFINAVSEAVPNLGKNGLDIYDRLADRAYAGRQQFQNEQRLVQDQARNFRVWLRDGVFRQIFVGMVGMPDKQLNAVNSQGVTVYGEEALKVIETPVIASQASDAFRTGTDKPVNPFAK